jgi:predicted lactoylglutathione lyase
MSTEIFVNLPVKDLSRTKDFFTKLGFGFDDRFADENAICMVISQNSYAMMLVEPFFKTFINKDLADSTRTTQSILALSLDSRAAVDELVDQALASGAEIAKEPSDMGFMYGRSFCDLDGHHWEAFYMDEAAAAEQFG